MRPDGRPGPALARTRSSPRGSSAALIATAVCDPLWGSIPIITAVIARSNLVIRDGRTMAGMPNTGSASARASFGPRHGENRQAGTSI
jgi:hypothetical protein